MGSMGLVRAARCAHCGRSVRGLPDARREGRRWFCSQSCLLQAESSGEGSGRSRPAASGPLRVLQKTVKWVLIGAGLIAVASLVAAIVGVGGTGESATRSNPVPFRHAADIGGGWKMRVLAVTRNANRRVAAASKAMNGHTAGRSGPLCSADYPCSPPPPARAQDFIVYVSLIYAGGGKADAGDIVNYGLRAMGAHNATYDVGSDSCGDVWPKPSLQNAGVLYSGGRVRGQVCFQIAKNDAGTLMLYTGRPTDAPEDAVVLGLPENIKQVWFALR